MINKDIKLHLAPMAGVADRAFRELCRENGADFLTSEMISSKAVYYKDKKTFELAEFSDSERPIAIQIFGSEPEIMAHSAKVLCEKFSPDYIDINMGCPVMKIVKSGDGSALMKKPELVYEIVSRVTSAVHTPVTVKIRSGWDEKRLNAVEIAELCEKAGAREICVHGKTKAQGYAPGVNLDIIKAVKQAVKIPVIGNGDIDSAEDAIKMLEYTGCDKIMIGRAALGSPWIFNQIKSVILGRTFEKPDMKKVMKEHVKRVCMYKPERTAICEMRKHVSWYIKGVYGAAELRDRVNRVETEEELFELIESIQS